MRDIVITLNMPLASSFFLRDGSDVSMTDNRFIYRWLQQCHFRGTRDDLEAKFILLERFSWEPQTPVSFAGMVGFEGGILPVSELIWG